MAAEDRSKMSVMLTSKHVSASVKYYTETLGFERADALLAEYVQPPLDDAVEAELMDYVGRRMSEIPKDMVA